MLIMRFILTPFFLISLVAVSVAQNNKIPKSFEVSQKSFELFSLINDERVKNDLKPIALSASLSYVAALHIDDLCEHQPDTGLCNLHSWSVNGSWTACCYQGYIPKQDCMWDKPKELTPYKYRGYELAFWQENELSAEEILAAWMEIPQAANMILNKGRWNNEWRALATGIDNGYAVVWFGRAMDKEPEPKIESKKTSLIKKESSIIKEKTNQYFLIFGSYRRLKDAEKRLKRIKRDGFTNAVILQNEENFRIALSAYQTLESAKSANSQLAKKYSEAWILKF